MQVMNDRSSSSASLDTTQMRERQGGRGERGRVQMALLRLLRVARVVQDEAAEAAAVDEVMLSGLGLYQFRSRDQRTSN